MSMRTDNRAKVKKMTRTELEAFVEASMNRSDNRRFRDQVTADDLTDAAADEMGEQMTLPLPTVLDARVRVHDDAGELDWKERDEASFKEHRTFNDEMETAHERAAGIRRRKGEKLDRWADEQDPAAFDHGAPIGDYLWRDTVCAICHNPFSAADPFERAHDVAVALGGGDGSWQWAHRSCNRSEGVG